MNLEPFIRPFANINVFKKQFFERDKATENIEASIVWGSGPLGIAQRSSVIYSPRAPSPLPEEEPTELPTFEFRETERTTHTVRITQTGKPENYVDVEVIDSITFEGPQGFYVYRFNNPQ